MVRIKTEIKFLIFLAVVTLVAFLLLYVYSHRAELFAADTVTTPVQLTSTNLQPTQSANTLGQTTAEPAPQPDNSTLTTAPAPSTSVTADSLNVLVDKTNSLPSSYVPADLVDLSAYGINTEGRNIKLRRPAANALKKLLTAMQGRQLNVVVISGFRSYSEQQTVYRGWVNKLGSEAADKTSAQPGHSEHQLGTTIDITLPNKAGELSSIYPGSPSREWQWLDQNAHKYGFVMSYRYGQESQTGYDFEPWHWRYVGADLARDIRYATLTPQSFYKPLAN